MRRIRPGFVVFVGCLTVLVAGGVVYGDGRHALGGAILAVALVGFGLLIAGGMSSQGRGGRTPGEFGPPRPRGGSAAAARSAASTARATRAVSSARPRSGRRRRRCAARRRSPRA